MTTNNSLLPLKALHRIEAEANTKPMPMAVFTLDEKGVGNF